MTLRHLKIFVTVCECGSVTAAAQKLFIAQPSVSKSIGELEAYYGIKLFDRLARKLCVTESGKQLLQYATHIVSLFNEMENNIKDWDNIGILRVGASITIGNCLLPGYIEAFHNLHPDIKVHALIDNSEKIEESILNNEIDFALIAGAPHSPYIIGERFMEDRMVLIAGLDHPFAKLGRIDSAQLNDQEFLLREKGSSSRELFDSILSQQSIKIKPVWQSVSTQAIVNAVGKGLGLSVLPYLLVKDNLLRGEVVQVHIKDISLKRKFSVIYHKNKFLTELSKKFIALCRTNNQ